MVNAKENLDANTMLTREQLTSPSTTSFSFCAGNN